MNSTVELNKEDVEHLIRDFKKNPELKSIEIPIDRDNKEPAIRLNMKRNFKGEFAWEVTIRGDFKEEIQNKIDDVKKILENEGFETKREK